MRRGFYFLTEQGDHPMREVGGMVSANFKFIGIIASRHQAMGLKALWPFFEAIEYPSVLRGEAGPKMANNNSKLIP